MKRSQLFKILYEQYEYNRTRYDNLHSRASETLKITGLVAAIFGLFAGKELILKASGEIAICLYLIGIITFVLSVLCSVVATSNKAFREIVDIKTIAITADKENYNEEDLYSIMLANMADCSDHNNKLIDTAFTWLAASRVAMALGIIFMTAGFLIQSLC